MSLCLNGQPRPSVQFSSPKMIANDNESSYIEGKFPKLLPAYIEVLAGLFKETVVDNLRHSEGLRDFRILPHHVDHQLHPFRLGCHVAGHATAQLPEHLACESPVAQLPLLHDDVEYFFAVARVQAEKRSQKRCSDHTVDLVWALLDFSC